MNFSQEAIFLNTMGAILIALAILIPCILGCEGFRYDVRNNLEEDWSFFWSFEEPNKKKKTFSMD